MNIISLIKRKMVEFRLTRKKRIWKKSGHIEIDDSVKIFPETAINANLGKVKIGERSCIRGSLEIQRWDGSINIGSDCYIGDHTRIWAAENIEIGDHVLIAHNCNIFDNDTHPLDKIERREDADNIIWKGVRKEYTSLRHAPILIGDDVWIGCGSVILKGVSIGGGGNYCCRKCRNKTCTS